jgi:hypothetical protein
MSEQDYAKLVMANMAHGDYHHGAQDRTEHTKPDDHHH